MLWENYELSKSRKKTKQNKKENQELLLLEPIELGVITDVR